MKEHLVDNRTIVQVAELLDKAGAPESDAGEPAWGAMGHMIRETHFVQVFRRLYFMKVMLCGRRMKFGTKFAPKSPIIVTAVSGGNGHARTRHPPSAFKNSPTGST